MSDPERRIVFVVEDDEDVRGSTRALLEASGYEVQDFASAEEVLANGDVGKAGCLVLDHKLAGMSGLDLVRQLRSQGIMTPAVLVSGQGNQLAAAAHKAGIATVLRKPISAEALEAWIEEVFSKPR